MKYECKQGCIAVIDGVKTLVNPGDVVESNKLPNRHFDLLDVSPDVQKKDLAKLTKIELNKYLDLAKTELDKIKKSDLIKRILKG